MQVKSSSKRSDYSVRRCDGRGLVTGKVMPRWVLHDERGISLRGFRSEQEAHEWVRRYGVVRYAPAERGQKR